MCTCGNGEEDVVFSVGRRAGSRTVSWRMLPSPGQRRDARDSRPRVEPGGLLLDPSPLVPVKPVERTRITLGKPAGDGNREGPEEGGGLLEVGQPAPHHRLEVLADHAAALSARPSPPASRCKYLSPLRGFLAWLVSTAVDGDPLTQYAAPGLAHVKAVGRRRRSGPQDRTQMTSPELGPTPVCCPARRRWPTVSGACTLGC